MSKGVISDDLAAAYAADGYALVRGLLDAEEVGLLSRAAREDRVLDQRSYGKDDGEGGVVRLSVWNHPTDTIYGMIARCESIVGSAAKLLGDEPYHYHSKMIMKDAKVGGAPGPGTRTTATGTRTACLSPNLTSAFIAVDRATRENGCLQVIRGPHLLGRIEHVLAGDQAGADLERVDEILKRHELVHVEMEPGDAVLPRQHPAPRRPEPLGQRPLVDDLLLQRPVQRPL